VIAEACRRHQTRLLVGALIALVVAMQLGDAAAPALLTGAPLVLVALNPRARNLLLASASVPAPLLIAVALTRRMASVPIIYRLGALHGTGALDWVDRHFRRIGRMTRAVERWFHRRRNLAVVVFPGGLTAFLAGDTAMPAGLVAALTGLGFLARLLFVLGLGELLSGPVDAVVGYIAEHQWQLTTVTLALTVAHLLRHRRRSRQLAVEEAVILGPTALDGGAL
jgi:membrane protein DedA with SNARE-associated domain